MNVDKDLLKYLLEDSMYDFTYVDNYTKGDWNIEENGIIRNIKEEFCIFVIMVKSR